MLLVFAVNVVQLTSYVSCTYKRFAMYYVLYIIINIVTFPQQVINMYYILLQYKVQYGAY
jgi:hypothetical protein